MFEEPGSEMSLKLQSSSAVKGLSIGPSNTLVGKHSRSTAEKVKNGRFNKYSDMNFENIYKFLYNFSNQILILILTSFCWRLFPGV